MNLFDTGVRPAVDAYIQSQRDDKRDYGPYWSASSAGYCKRKLIFERLGVPHSTEDDPRLQRVFSAGHIFHDWMQGITKNAGLSIASEVELQDEDLMIRGHFDDLILIQEPASDPPENAPSQQEPYPGSSRLILYDYKTAHSKSFTYSKGRPMSHYHKMQLGTYMYMLRKWERIQAVTDIQLVNMEAKDLTEARILTISKDDLRMDEKQLLWSEELERMVLKFWTELNQCWESRVIPPCDCMEHESGFMAKEKFNPYFYDGEPCSINYYNKWKEDNNVNL